MNRKKLQRRTALAQRIHERCAELFHPPYRITDARTGRVLWGAKTREEARRTKRQNVVSGAGPLVIERRTETGEYVAVR